MSSTKLHHVSIQGDTGGGDADSDTVDSEYARHAAAFAAARKRKASYHYQGKRRAAPRRGPPTPRRARIDRGGRGTRTSRAEPDFSAQDAMMTASPENPKNLQKPGN